MVRRSDRRVTPKRVLVRLGLAGAVVAGVCGPAAASDDPASARDADACEADSHRLCDKFFPDEKRVATCLVDQRAQLSQACAEVLARPPSGADEE